MPDVQKTPLVATLNRFTEAAQKAGQQLLGKAVPASVVSVDPSNTIVTVKFELQSLYTLPHVTCPVFGPEFLRYPLRAGVLGMVVSADYYMGGMSGLGGGIATLDKLANLSTCVFFPVGNIGNTPTPNANAGVLYGPDGAILTNENRDPLTIKIVVDGDNNVLIYGARSVSTDVHGYGERLTWQGGSDFLHETWHNGANVTEVPFDYHPPEIPAPS